MITATEMNTSVLKPHRAALYNANIAIPASCHERVVRKSLVEQMMRLPISARNAFVNAAPDEYKAYLTVKSIESNIPVKKSSVKAYSNNYKRKPQVTTPAPVVKVERNETLQLPVKPQFGVVLSDTEWCAFPVYPNKKPMSNRAMSSTGVMEGGMSYPAPVPASPAVKVGVEQGMKALAEKAKTAAAKTPRKKGEFKTPSYTGRALISDRYGEALREEVAKMQAAQL